MSNAQKGIRLLGVTAGTGVLIWILYGKVAAALVAVALLIGGAYLLFLIPSAKETVHVAPAMLQGLKSTSAGKRMIATAIALIVLAFLILYAAIVPNWYPLNGVVAAVAIVLVVLSGLTFVAGRILERGSSKSHQ